VKQALKMRDDSIVILRGNIVRRIGDDKYLFRDATGEIVVEIDDEDWGGVTAGPKDTLELSGEIDRDFNKVKVDVYLVKKVSGAAPAKQGFVE
ncbi:MAG: NirD/YgiW/YdeI family stress tolerance protein, partial [Treponema sp.]|nr:NirD/YgiW/YdeI family stress tolerance protein [Treponema sp.]